MKPYGKKEYWDERYVKQPNQYDWYVEYASFKDVLRDKGIINPHDNILNIGCGNSRLPKDMFEDGYKSITSIDYSEPVISKMSEIYKEESFKFQVMDITKMEFKDATFDAVIDKGTLDSILCGDNTEKLIEGILKEINRVLVPEGVFICISNSLPEFRESYFKLLKWELSVIPIKKSSMFAMSSETNDDAKKSLYFYMYVLKKKIIIEPTEEEKAEMRRKEEEAKKAEEARLAEEAKKLEEQKEAEKKKETKKKPKKM